MVEEFMTGNDYVKIYDFLKLKQSDFLNTYSYINNESYNLSMNIAMKPEYLADLFRQAENLLQLENDNSIGNISYMQEEDTEYISAQDWKWVIIRFARNNYTKEQFEELENICYNMGV